MKTIVLIASIFCFVLIPTSSAAQDVVQHSVDDSIRLQARHQANDLMQSLGLTTKQALLVEDKLTEFIRYKKKIVDSNIPVEKKTAKLKKLNNHKFSEIHDILTQRQYDVYVKMQ